MNQNIIIPRVNHINSPKSGNPVANQYTIRTCDGVFFQSYGSIIAFRDYATGKITLDESRWDYSRTTGKYRNAFLGENTADTRKKIKSGEYAVANLNSNRI